MSPGVADGSRSVPSATTRMSASKVPASVTTRVGRPGKRVETYRFLRSIRQKVKRAPNWTWRGVLIVLVMVPKLAGLRVCPAANALFAELTLGTLGLPNCALLKGLWAET